MKKMLFKNIIISTIQEINLILFKQHKKKLLFMLFLILLGSVLDVIGLAVILPVANLIFNPENIHKSHFIQSIYKTLGFTNDTYFLYFLLACLGLVFLLKNAAAVVISYLQTKFSYGVATDLSQKLFKNILNRDLQYFNDHNSTNLVRNIQIYPFHFSTYLLLPTLILLSEVIVVLIILIAISLFNITVIGLMVVTLLPSFILTYKLIRNRTQFYEMERNRLNTELTRQAYQTIHGYIDVKLFNKEMYFMTLFGKNQQSIKRVYINAFTLNLVPSKIIEITAISAIIIMFGYTLFSPEIKENIATMIPLFIAAAYRVMPSMNRMLIALGSIKGYQYVIGVIKDSLPSKGKDSAYEIDEPLDYTESIEFRDLSYKYPSGNKLSVDSLNLKISKGQKIGIIGKSGSGKTTLINILLRFLKEQQGGLYVDGKKITQSNENNWRQIIGYVKQNVFIIDGNFYDNIAFGVPKQDVDHKKMDNVLKLSQLYDVVQRLPQGLNTNIGENGAKLSGGQRQRIAIARALYKDAQILIFDEATSALDSETEKEITESIEAISNEHKTMFIIAHRITTLKNCDVIYEMEDGKLKNSYSYDEIVKSILEAN